MIGKYPVTDPGGDDGRVAIVRAIRDRPAIKVRTRTPARRDSRKRDLICSDVLMESFCARAVR
jgi:hypothetical protein